MDVNTTFWFGTNERINLKIKKMKKMKILIICTMLLSLVSTCKKETADSEAEQFVKLVQEDKYDKEFLPNLLPGDIPVLLKYADDYSVIQNFPTNPISSFQSPRLTVCECLLWTVESIRIAYDKDSPYEKFPSLTAQVIDSTIILQGYLPVSKLEEVYNLYNTWWVNGKNDDFEDLRKINPLENSNYRWW